MSYLASQLPEQLPVGIVHLGLGAFHRAHQAVYTEDAIVQGGGKWGICAVAMRSRDLATVMSQRNGRYSLIEQQPAGPVLREISVIREILCLPDSPEAVAARIADHSVHVVTVTVTEKGYCFSGGDRQLNVDHPQIAHDLAAPDLPISMPGVLVRGLQLRYGSGGRGMTILSCDNLPANGKLLQRIVIAYAARIDETLADWISRNCRFPDSMVDRITPAANSATLVLAAELRGQPDPAAIETEPFSQWVMEDDFAGPHPAWDKAGAQIVDKVAPYEDMKLRMLNGAHSLIAYLGAVAGLSAVRDVMAVPAFREVVARHMSEAAETLIDMSKQDASDYKAELLSRFENPAIDHRCLQIAMDGSQKLPQRIFVPAKIRLEQDAGTATFALAAALWFVYLQGRNETGEKIDCGDPLVEELQQIVGLPDSVHARVIALGRVTGVTDGLFDNDRWVDQVSEMIHALVARGCLSVVTGVNTGSK